MDIETLRAEAGGPPHALVGVDSQSKEAIHIELAQVGHTLLLGKPSATKNALWSMLLQLTGTSSPEDLQVTFLNEHTETASLLRGFPHAFDLSQFPRLFEGREMGPRHPCILVVAEDLDAAPRSRAIELLLQVGRKWAVGMIATASSPQISETILANTLTQIFLPLSDESRLEAWQKRLLNMPVEQETRPGRALLLLDGKIRWIFPLQLPAPQTLLRFSKEHSQRT